MYSNLIYSNVDESEVDITFVIPTYKRTKYLGEALESIVQIDEITSTKYEILIINNDPTDLMEEVIAKYSKYPISVYINQENYGMIGNVNQGARLAKGVYISFLHDDDYLLANYYKVLKDELKKGYDCLITGRYLLSDKPVVNTKGKILNLCFFYRHLYRRKIGQINIKDCLYSSRNIYLAPTCGTLFLKKALVEYGYFKDTHGLAWDYYNFRKFNANHKVAIVRDFVAVYRLTSGASNSEKTRRDFVEDQYSIVEENRLDSKFVNVFANEIKYQCSKLLMDEKDEIHFSKSKYILYLLLTNLYFYSKNLDISKTVTQV